MHLNLSREVSQLLKRALKDLDSIRFALGKLTPMNLIGQVSLIYRGLGATAQALFHFKFGLAWQLPL